MKPLGMHARVSRVVSVLMLFLNAIGSLAAREDPRLVEAAQHRELARVRQLLAQEADVNVPQLDGATALHWAAHWDDLEMVELLIRARANVNAANELGVTPLALACENGSARMVERLLTAGANPNAALPSGETALMTASRSGSVGAVEALLARGADIDAKESSRGQTALMWAVAQQHSEVVQVLVRRGAAVQARSKVRHVYVNTGARANREVNEGGFTPLLFAARHGDVRSAALLLGAGANVNDTAPDGTSALVIAAHSGHGAFGRFLLERGADPDSAGAGYTALHAAVLRGELALVTALLTRGANPNSRLERGTPVTRNGKDWVLLDTWAGATPIWLAAKFLEFEIIRALAAGGADVRLPSADGTTPLMVAAGVGWGREAVDRRERTSFVDPTKAPDDGPALGVVKLLMELGADSRAANKAGDTALHGAAAKGLNALVQFLVTSGASLDVKNKRAQTPLAATMGGSMDGKAQFEFEYLRSTAALLRRLGAKQ